MIRLTQRQIYEIVKYWPLYIENNKHLFIPNKIVLMFLLSIVCAVLFWVLYSNDMLTDSRASRPAMCVKTKDAMGKCIMQCKTKLGTINAACPAVIRKTGETKEKQPEENGANTSNPETTGESTTCNAACQWQRKRDHAQAELDYCNEHPGEEGCTPSDIDQLEDELDNGEGAPGNPNTDPDESGQGEDCDVLPDSPNCN